MISQDKKILFRIVSLVYIVFGSALILLGIFGAGLSMDLGFENMQDAYAPYIPQIVLGLLSIITGVGIWGTKKWAYILGLLLLLIFIMGASLNIIIVF